MRQISRLAMVVVHVDDPRVPRGRLGDLVAVERFAKARAVERPDPETQAGSDR